MPWTREKKYFASLLIWRKNHSKLSQNRFNPLLLINYCKKFKFDHTNKTYMQNPEPARENGTHKLLRDFEIQIDQLISARRLDLVIVNKKENLLNSGLCRPVRPQDKIEGKRKER